METINIGKREQFIRDGFAVFEQILEAEMLAKLRAWSDEILAQQEEEHFRQQRTTGSMVLIDWQMAYQYDVLAKLIVHPNVLAALAELGFDEPKFGHYSGTRMVVSGTIRSAIRGSRSSVFSCTI